MRLLAKLGLRAEYGPFFRVFDRDFLEDAHCGRKTFDEAAHAFLISAGLSAGQADEACRAGLVPPPQRGRVSALDRRPRNDLAARRRGRDAGSVVQQRAQRRHAAAAVGGTYRRFALVGRRLLAIRAARCPTLPVTRRRLAAIKLSAADVAFVGRDPLELRGAKSQGIATIAFNAELDAVANVHLQRFEDLLELCRFSPAHTAAA